MDFKEVSNRNRLIDTTVLFLGHEKLSFKQGLNYMYIVLSSVYTQFFSRPDINPIQSIFFLFKFVRNPEIIEIVYTHENVSFNT